MPSSLAACSPESTFGMASCWGSGNNYLQEMGLFMLSTTASRDGSHHRLLDNSKLLPASPSGLLGGRGRAAAASVCFPGRCCQGLGRWFMGFQLGYAMGFQVRPSTATSHFPTALHTTNLDWTYLDVMLDGKDSTYWTFMYQKTAFVQAIMWCSMYMLDMYYLHHPKMLWDSCIFTLLLLLHTFSLLLHTTNLDYTYLNAILDDKDMLNTYIPKKLHVLVHTCTQSIFWRCSVWMMGKVYRGFRLLPDPD
jgi:hypothetical protein